MHKKSERAKPWRSKAGAAKISKVFHEQSLGKLHSGSKQGPKVTGRKQTIAIALSEGRKAARGK